LVAKGSSTENIILTGKEKNKGYWKGVLFISNSAENELDHVIISFAGSNPLPEMGMVKTNVGLAGGEGTGSAAKISNSNFTESSGYGLYVGGMSQLNYFSGNYFTNNSSSALYVPAGQLHKLDFFSHYTGNNGYNGVETGGTVKQIEEASWSYFNDGSKYLVSSDLSIESGVHITEGASFEFAKDILLRVVDQGYLNATGTSDKPVIFTAKVKMPDNFWRGISFASSQESNNLQHVVISHAGFRPMPDITVKANLAVAPVGKVSVLNSKIENGLGWGIVAEPGAQINGDVITSNYLNQLAEGKYKFPFSEAITASLAGDWLDQWSFNNQHPQIHANFFDQESETWFNGGADPWSMDPQTGFGLKINADGSYLWTIAEHSPSSPECVSYSAEYITGNMLASGDELSFAENSWRSKFYNSCDTEQNVDLDVEPGTMVLRYEINRMYNVFTYVEYWQLRIINPDNSSFTYYKF
jgi:hypothetical protein